MKNITGPPVIGDDFYGRANEIKYVWNRLQNGNNIILPSPRRVGKTSFALKLIEIAAMQDWDTVKLNLEKVSTQQDFLIAFTEELKKLSWWSSLKDKGNKVLEQIKALKPTFAYGEASLKLEWEKSIENVYQELDKLLSHETPTLIFFDELTILLTAINNRDEEGISAVTNFLHWLRDIRIRGGSKIRWIFCSSVGIENFTHRLGISDTLNDIPQYELKSYDKPTSVDMLMLLAEDKLPLTEEIAKKITEKLDFCLPFFLQITFEKIDMLYSVEGEAIDAEIVEKAYDKLITENHFNTWIERISAQYDVNTAHAFAILKQLCQSQKGMSRENLVNVIAANGAAPQLVESIVSELLYMLKNDGYLIEEDRMYKFRSPLLRDFWYNRFIK